MPVRSRPYLYAISILLMGFGVYNYIVYNAESYLPAEKLSSQAIMVQQLFQSNRCWSCHQLYGLGGYLGPDLTNIYSDEKKGSLYIKAFLNSGVKSMPQFAFDEDEKNAIVEYLRQVDQSGIYPNYDAEINAIGWVKIKYRNEK